MLVIRLYRLVPKVNCVNGQIQTWETGEASIYLFIIDIVHIVGSIQCKK